MHGRVVVRSAIVATRRMKHSMHGVEQQFVTTAMAALRSLSRRFVDTERQIRLERAGRALLDP